MPKNDSSIVDEIVTIDSDKGTGVDSFVDKDTGNRKVDEPIVRQITQPPLPFPQTLKHKKEEGKFKKFTKMLKDQRLIIPLHQALEKIHGYGRFMKELVKKRRTTSFKDNGRVYHFSVVTSKSLA